MQCLKCILAATLLGALALVAFIYSGLYPMGADDRHNALSYWALETLRERSIARAAAELVVPEDLQSPKRLLAGGADYKDMCASCHLQPGVKDSDFSLGLYPAPPKLTEKQHAHTHESGSGDDGAQAGQRRKFWVIKHGIKASGMPAWGIGHDDERIWNMVAFLERLPSLTPLQYQILTARTEVEEPAHDMRE
jgi:mono/diheme cytochrome c family protein